MRNIPNPPRTALVIIPSSKQFQATSWASSGSGRAGVPVPYQVQLQQEAVSPHVTDALVVLLGGQQPILQSLAEDRRALSDAIELASSGASSTTGRDRIVE